MMMTQEVAEENAVFGNAGALQGFLRRGIIDDR